MIRSHENPVLVHFREHLNGLIGGWQLARSEAKIWLDLIASDPFMESRNYWGDAMAGRVTHAERADAYRVLAKLAGRTLKQPSALDVQILPDDTVIRSLNMFFNEAHARGIATGRYYTTDDLLEEAAINDIDEFTEEQAARALLRLQDFHDTYGLIGEGDAYRHVVQVLEEDGIEL